MFVAPEEDRYELAPRSPASKIGFEVIPLDRVGLVEDEYRRISAGGPARGVERDRCEITFKQALLPMQTSLSFGSITGYEIEQWRKKKSREG